MPHALTSNFLHCVFSTKDRTNSTPDPQALGRYLGGVAREKNLPPLIAGGTNNHLHLLIALPAAFAAGESCPGTEGQQFEMAERAWVEVCLAGRIRRFQRQSVEQTSG
jgi:REP-associated tyrosine transposase